MKACYRSLTVMVLAAVVWLALFEPNERTAAAKPVEPVRLSLTVRVDEHAELSSSLTLDSPALTRSFKHANWLTLADRPPIYPDLEVTISSGGQTDDYKLEANGRLWQETSHRLLELPAQASRTMLSLAQTVRGQYYGRKRTWEETKKLLPNKSIFTVTDLQTGLSFRVQRRAGSDHADVQPIAKEDTRIMKQIFGGEWSWKRRAILVRFGNEYIAASMNGMPHGGDGIPDNDFSGHFCIHYYLSTTHKSETPDLAHQLMVHKASGELRPYLDSANPSMLARSYIEALNHKDRTVIRQVAYGMPEGQINDILLQMEGLDSIRDTTKKGHSQREQWDQQLTAQVNVPVDYRMRNQSQRNAVYRFSFSRPDTATPWRIQQIDSGHIRPNSSNT